MRLPSPPAALSPGEVDHLVHLVGIAVSLPGLTDWERRFAASTLAAARRGAWWPSARQAIPLQGIARKVRAAIAEAERETPGGGPENAH